MHNLALMLAVTVLTVAGFAIGRRRAVAATAGRKRVLHSLPGFHGAYVALWCALPAIAIAGIWLALEPRIVESLVVDAMPETMRSLPPAELEVLVNEMKNIANGYFAREPDPALNAAAERYTSLRATGFAAMAVVALAAGVAGLNYARRRIAATFRARIAVERVVGAMLLASSTLAVFVTIGIVLSLLFESIRFFSVVPITDFLFGLSWRPQMAIREDQAAGEGSFGAIPVILGTFVITAIAMAVAGPIGLLTAIYTSRYAPPRARAIIKPVLEILAGIPTVVYGFFAALTVAPLFRDVGAAVGLDIASESALAAGVVMGIMIIPFVSSLADDVMSAVPGAMRDGSLALGATESETIRRVIIPAALPGIVGAFLLAISRAIGETMIVAMAAGLAAKLSASPLDALTTVTVQIVVLLVGDQEFDSPKTLAAFALGLLLFVITLLLNVVAHLIVKKYREKYD